MGNRRIYIVLGFPDNTVNWLHFKPLVNKTYRVSFIDSVVTTPYLTMNHKVST